jgi:hypothetical protein
LTFSGIWESIYFIDFSLLISCSGALGGFRKIMHWKMKAFFQINVDFSVLENNNIAHMTRLGAVA